MKYTKKDLDKAVDDLEKADAGWNKAYADYWKAYDKVEEIKKALGVE